MTFTEFIKRYTPDYRERELKFIEHGVPRPLSKSLRSFRESLFPEALDVYTSEVIAEARRVKYKIPNQETTVIEEEKYPEKYNRNSNAFGRIQAAIDSGYVEFAHNEWAGIDEIREKCNCKMLTKAGFMPIEKVTIKESSSQINWSKFRIPRFHAPPVSSSKEYLREKGPS